MRLRLPLLLFVAAATLRLLAFLGFYLGSVLMGHHGVVDPYDPVGYDTWAWYAAEHLRSGVWVDLRLKSLEGSWDIGFTYLVAFEYAIVGHHPEVARIVNCFLAAFTAPAAYRAAKRTSIPEPIAARAGWLVACWPLSIYWAGLDLLKDPLIWCFVALGLLSLSAPTAAGRSVLGAIAAAGAYVTRNYMGPGLALLLLIGGVLKKDWRGLAGLVAGLVLVQVLLSATGFPPVWKLNAVDSTGQIASGHGAATEVCTGASTALVAGTDCAPPIEANPKSLLLRFAVGIPIELFGPGLRPLRDVAHPTLDWGMYPGLIAWIALFPFALLGLWRGVRTGDRTLWSFAVFGLGIWASLAFIYAGHALRQREMAFPVTLVFASLGTVRPWPRWWWPSYAAYLVTVVVALVWEAAAV